MTKQLAIIIPAYKDTFLRKALDSIAAQTCQDFTLYIGDDCSPYDIGAIVDEYKDKIDLVYKRFEINLGSKDLVAQWERCIDLSKDEPYIWLFSDDDIMEPCCVEEFINLRDEIKDHHLIHFNVEVINELSEGILESKAKYPQLLSGVDFMKKKVSGEIVSFVVEYIFSRELFYSNGRFLNFDLAWGSDILTWFKLANCCQGIYTIEKYDAHVRWRRSDYNISPNVSKEIVLRKMFSLIENASFVQSALVELGEKRNFAIHAKSIWTAIVRHSVFVDYNDLLTLYRTYLRKVGFPVQSTIFYLYANLSKLLHLYHGY